MFDLSLIEDRKNDINYFAKTKSRGKEIYFGIKDKDRMKHVYVIGKTGMGKSTMIENMAAQDIINGNGLCFIDPHGSAVEFLIEYVPKERIEDVIYFTPFDDENPMGFNVMEDVGVGKRHLIAQGLVSSLKKVFGEESFSDRMEHILNNVILALLEYPNTTLLSMTRILTDNNYKKKVVANITDPSVKAFWENEYNKWEERYRKEAVSSILNKIGQFTSNPIIRNIVGQTKSAFDFRKAMDEKKIILVNLSIGQLGEGNANLLGALFTTKIFLSAMSRAEHTAKEIDALPGFYFYIDEFQNLTSDTFADILSQARKYKLSLTVAHQYIEQMPDVVRDAIFGNVGTIISFRVGAAGAKVLETEYSGDVEVRDLVSLGFTNIYLMLSIDGVTSSVFSASTLPPIKKPEISFTEEVVRYTRENYTKPVSVINDEILNWMNISDKKENLPKKNEKKDSQKKEFVSISKFKDDNRFVKKNKFNNNKGYRNQNNLEYKNNKNILGERQVAIKNHKSNKFDGKKNIIRKNNFENKILELKNKRNDKKNIVSFHERNKTVKNFEEKILELKNKKENDEKKKKSDDNMFYLSNNQKKDLDSFLKFIDRNIK